MATTTRDVEEGGSSSIRLSSRLAEPLQNFLSEVGVVNTSRHAEEQPNNNASTRSAPPSIFESSLDLTPERLRYVFERFDTDEDGKLSYESLRNGLDFAGAPAATDEASFSKLIEHLDMDQSGDISFPEFCEGLRLLMLRDLFRRTQKVVEQAEQTDQGAATLEVMDYDTVRFERKTVVNDDGGGEKQGRTGAHGQEGDNNNNEQHLLDATDFYFNHQPDWVQTRWVHVSGGRYNSGALTMQLLAVMYALHPLALEDALSPDSHRPKAELYTSHYFLMVPYFSIQWREAVTPAEASRSRKWVCAVPNLIRRWFCNKGYQPRTNSSIKKNKTTQIASIHSHMASVFVNTPASDTMITYVWSGNDSSDDRLWQRVQQDLEFSYSKLRQYDAQYLVYALLDEAVDAIDPIVAAVASELEQERQRLRTSKFDSLDRIHFFKQELYKVSQKLKPFMRLLTHVIEDDAISPGATIYLRDVLDNLEGCDEEVRQLLLHCEAVDDDADKFQSRQMDQTLYTLTVISAVFLPAQFLTGKLIILCERAHSLEYRIDDEQNSLTVLAALFHPRLQVSGE